MSRQPEIMTAALAGDHREFASLHPILRPGETAAGWYNHRRPELLALFEKYAYGVIPPRPQSVEYQLVREKCGALDGLAIRREIEVICRQRNRIFTFPVLWYLPAAADGPVPCVTALNFCGNAGITEEDDIPDDLEPGKERGFQRHRWELPYFMEQRISVITAPRNAIFRDHPCARPESIYSLFHSPEELTASGRDYTAISAWAAGCRLLLELALTDPARVDSRRIWVHGHSRLGKTALWAGANDLRFAGVISNDSGCCGASLFQGQYGETLPVITRTFPHWFTELLDRYADCPEKLPFDQHFLLALAAPRPLIVHSASEDEWASPACEFAAACAASPVYRLFGAAGLPDNAAFPEPEGAIYGDGITYACRRGIHDVTRWDWEVIFRVIHRTPV